MRRHRSLRRSDRRNDLGAPRARKRSLARRRTAPGVPAGASLALLLCLAAPVPLAAQQSPAAPFPSSTAETAAPTENAVGGPRNVVPWLKPRFGESGAPNERPSAAAPSDAPVIGDPSTGSEAAAPSGDPVLGLPPEPGAPSGAAALPAPLRPDAAGAQPLRPVAPPDPRAPTDPRATVSIGAMTNVRAAAAGLAAPETIGLEINAWGATPEATAVDLVRRLRPSALHAANRFAIELLVVALEPPQAQGPRPSDGDLFTHRLEALMRFGAVDRAALLGEAAGDPLHPIAVDAALIAGREPVLCDALLDRGAGRGSEGLELARIYCLSFVDDAVGAGAGAAVAISAARALGGADETTLDLLEAAADPSLAEFVEPPSAIADFTPLRIAALRRAGVALPADFARAAPISHLAAVLYESAPRSRLIALERLETAGAVETAILSEAYAAAQSAESGGVWGRVEAYRKAVASQLTDTIRSFRLAIDRAASVGRDGMMARLTASELASRAMSGAPMRDAALRRAMRLGGEGQAASELLTPSERRAAGPEERAIDRIANPAWRGEWAPRDLNALLARAARGDQRAGRIMAALSAFDIETPSPTLYSEPAGLADAIADGRIAEIAFGAAARLSAGDGVSPEDLYAALSMLVALGRPELARQVAVEAILQRS